MLYHPDGRECIVETEDEQSARGDEWVRSPAEAQKARSSRDEADAARAARKIGAEFKAAKA